MFRFANAGSCHDQKESRRIERRHAHRVAQPHYQFRKVASDKIRSGTSGGAQPEAFVMVGVD
jgi:hypothetical protein